MNNSIVIKHLGRVALVVTLLMALFSSCVRDETVPAPNVDDDSKVATVRFALNLPNSERPSAESRSLSGTVDELKIDNLTVFVFKGGKYAYQSRPKPTSVANAYTVDLLKGGPYELMVVANLNGEIPYIAKDEDKKDVLDKILILLDDNSPEWDIESRALPMASAVRLKDNITEGTSFTGSDAISLYRALAKVNIAVEQNAGFKLESVHLFNYNKEGRVVPKFVNGELVENVPSSPLKVMGPLNFTPESEKACTNKIYLLEVLNNKIVSDESVPLPEDERTAIVVGGKPKDMSQVFYYRIDFSKKVDEESLHFDLIRNHLYDIVINSIDFEGESTPKEAFDAGPANVKFDIIVWNQAAIKYVKSNGEYSIGVEDIEVRHEGKASVGNTMLVMSDYPETIKRFSSLAKVDPVEGDCLWIKNVDLKEKESKNGMKSYDLLYDLDANSGDFRTGYIHLVADNIDLAIEIEQAPEVFLRFLVKDSAGDWVEVEDGQVMTFIQESPIVAAEPQVLRVEWSPIEAAPSTSFTGSSSSEYIDIAWVPSSSVTASGDGFMEFNVNPMLKDYERGSFDEGRGNFAAKFTRDSKLYEKKIDFEQSTKDIFIVPEFLIMDGEEHYVTVKSNVPWTLHANKNIGTMSNVPEHKVVEEVGGVPLTNAIPNDSDDYTLKNKAIILEGKPNKGGTRVPVTTYNDIGADPKPHVYLGHLGLYAESIDNSKLFDGKPINCGSGIPQDGREANCYVLDPTDGVGLLIPVQAANGVFDQTGNTNWKGSGYYLANGGYPGLGGAIESDTKYEAKLVWSDVMAGNGTGLGADGLIYKVIPAGVGPKGYILVLPGRKAKSEGGNAVVAVTHPTEKDKNGELKTLWSWHIWVTDGMVYSGNIDNTGTPMTGILRGGHFGSQMDENDKKVEGSETWLDRNLGALNNGYDPIAKKTALTTPNDLIRSRGVHYQWGRKDPFPTAEKLISGAKGEGERTLYSEKGPIEGTKNWGSVTHNEDGAVDNDFADAMKYPLTFYRSWKNVKYITGVSANTWGHIGDKTIFDPCPAGWRLTMFNDWDGSNTQYWAAMVNNGRTYTRADFYKGGYYPAAGYRLDDLNSYGVSGGYWSRSPYGSESKNSSGLHFYSSTSVTPRGNYDRYSGRSVRCVAE